MGRGQDVAANPASIGHWGRRRGKEERGKESGEFEGGRGREESEKGVSAE